jgi:hypothetical protein
LTDEQLARLRPRYPENFGLPKTAPIHGVEIMGWDGAGKITAAAWPR